MALFTTYSRAYSIFYVIFIVVMPISCIVPEVLAPELGLASPRMIFKRFSV